MANLSTIAVRLTGSAVSLNRSLDQAQSRVDRFRNRSRQAFDAVKRSAIGLSVLGATALTGLAVSAVKSAADIEAGFAEVRTLLPELSDEGFDRLKDSVLAFSKEVGLATSETIPALYQAISGGIPEENVVEFLGTASKLSIGGVTELSNAVDVLTTISNSYGASALTAQQNSDLLFTAVRLGKTTVDELSRSLFNVIPTAANLGVGFDQVAAAMAVMTAQGVPTSVATTQLRQLLNETGNETSKLGVAIQEVTGKSFRDLIAEGETVSSVLQMLRNDSRVTDQVFQSLFGSTEAYNAALALTGDGAAAFNRVMEEMRNSTGATDKAFNTIANTTQFKTNKAWNEFKLELAAIGEEFLPFVNIGLRIVRGGLEDTRKNVENFMAKVREWRDRISGWIDAVVGGFNAVRDAAAGIGSLLGGIGSIGGGFSFGLPGFAGGVENFRGGLAVVGERGPEVVNLPRGSDVMPAREMGGPTIHITVNGSVMGADLEEIVHRAVVDNQRQVL